MISKSTFLLLLSSFFHIKKVHIVHLILKNYLCVGKFFIIHVKNLLKNGMIAKHDLFQ